MYASQPLTAAGESWRAAADALLNEAERIGPLEPGVFGELGTDDELEAAALRIDAPAAATEPAAAGAGFVNPTIVINHLAAITGADLWGWFASGAMPERLAALTPFVASELRDLSSAVGRTGPTVKFDYKTGRWAALPVVDDAVPNDWHVDLTGVRA